MPCASQANVAEAFLVPIDDLIVTCVSGATPFNWMLSGASINAWAGEVSNAGDRVTAVGGEEPKRFVNERLKYPR